MDLGSIYRVLNGATTATSFIEPNTTNDLVSVLGLYAHQPSNRLWVCSSDAGNAQRSGLAPVALKSFNLTTGAFVGSWAWPAPPASLTPIPGATVNGFCNDITIDADGNVYATDSWYPRVLRLVDGGAGAAVLTNWLVNTTVFPVGQWHLNGIDIDTAGNNLYVVENHPGHLYRVPIMGNGMPGTVVEITTQRPLYGPDGLKVQNPNMLITAEGSGISVIDLSGTTGRVRTVSTGFDGVATFAMRQGNAWLVENQGDHFWGPTGPQGPTATKPFRLVETPLEP
jgi:sugar lactone lactonase YvrE